MAGPSARRMALVGLVVFLGSACSAAGAYPDYSGRDLDCDDIGHPVRVEGADPHGLDRDGDGIGCESY